MTTQDPFAAFRAMMSDWSTKQKGAAEDSPAAAFRSLVDQALAAANMPSRTDVEALGARLTAVEQSLARIEGQLANVKPRKAKKAKAEG